MPIGSDAPDFIKKFAANWVLIVIVCLDLGVWLLVGSMLGVHVLAVIFGRTSRSQRNQR